MQAEIFNHEFNKIFKGFTNESVPNPFNFEFDPYEKLGDFLLPGDSYFFVLNYHTLEFEMVSKSVKDVLGYEVSELSMPFLNEKIHPEDLPWFLTFGKIIINFFSQLPLEKLMKYKVRFDIRLRKNNGDYARILYQGILIEHDNEGKFLRSLNVHSDISYLKHDGKPTISMIGMDGEPSYIDIGIDNMFKESHDDLSKREKEILILLIEGRLSKEIGSFLHISKQTVDTHRKNMLHKKHLSNTGELIGKAIRYGWI